MIDGHDPQRDQFESWRPNTLPPEIGELDIFRYPKDPERPQQFEDDADFHYFQRSPREKQLVLAVADGATEAILSAVWARALVNSYVRRPAGKKYAMRPDWWDVAREEFKNNLDITQLPWYAIEKLANGSFATFGGMTIYWPERQYSVAGYGDVVIAIADQDDVIVYPQSLQNASNFSNRPSLVGTVTRPEEKGNLQNRRNLPRSECSIYLMTDAIGAWFVGELSKGKSEAIKQVNAFEASSFATFVDNASLNRLMRTDDVALIRLRLARPG